MMLPVAVSSVTEHEAMSPAPTNTGSALGVVWKFQVGPVVITVPSLTVMYHSNSWPASRLAHEVVVLEPEATPVFCAIWVNTPLAYSRPKKVTVNGSLLLGSDTLTSRVGEVPTPVAPLAGALRVGAFGAWFTAGGSKPSTQAGPLVRVPGKLPTELLVIVPEPSFIPQRATRPAPVVISEFFVLWISDWLRAIFQTRASSMVPAKKPGLVPGRPVLRRAEPRAACWILVDSGVNGELRLDMLSSTPSRYSRQVCPS